MMDNKRVELAERFSEMWQSSRKDAGKSQEYMAKALGVSRRTIQNWEDGTASPSQAKGFEWFAVLGVQPLPYYLKTIYSIFATEDDDENETDSLLKVYFQSLPTEAKKKLLYLAYGSHGSSPLCILELVTAYLKSPLAVRVAVAEMIATNYEIGDALGMLKESDVEPNVELLRRAIKEGRVAVLTGKDGYTII